MEQQQSYCQLRMNPKGLATKLCFRHFESILCVLQIHIHIYTFVVNFMNWVLRHDIVVIVTRQFKMYVNKHNNGPFPRVAHTS